jgi:CRISP-associated protein Cas1
LLKGPAASLEFRGRQRRPPSGPANALLSYSYAVLAGQCAAAALAAGLDPAEGFLHATRAGRPALALDLLEPFRASVADSATLFMLNTGELTAGDFAGEDGHTLLTAPGRRKALAGLERRLDEHYTEDGRCISYRAAMDRLAHTLAQALVTGTADKLAPPERL